MKNNRKKKRIIFVSSVLAISLIALTFIILNFRDNIVFFYSPSELKEANISSNKQIRVGGLVVDGSVQRVNASITMFTITDLEEELDIKYQGLLPDLFREGQGIVAKGTLDVKKNEFFSNDLLVKHDEKYMPPEVAKSLKHGKE